MGSNANESPYKGSAQITREQFLFYEMRITAKLIREGRDDEVIERIVDENLFQYPTEKSIKQMARICMNRLRAMDDEELIKVENLADTLQVCLDSGAKKVLLPQTSFTDFATVPPELMSAFQLIPYQSAEDAVFKALGVE